MKKLLSIALAVVMMFAICVPSFATEINESEPTAVDGKQTAQSEVVTTYDETSDWFYTVTIPAGVQIPWNNTTEQDITYSVESQLLLGASLKISAAADNNGLMENSDTTDGFNLTYEITAGADVVEFSEVNAEGTTGVDADGNAVVNGTNVKVKIADFKGVAVGTYTGTLTYTVEYVAPDANTNA